MPEEDQHLYSEEQTTFVSKPHVPFSHQTHWDRSHLQVENAANFLKWLSRKVNWFFSPIEKLNLFSLNLNKMYLFTIDWDGMP